MFKGCSFKVFYIFLTNRTLLTTLILILLTMTGTDTTETKNIDTPYCNERHQDDKCICFLEAILGGLTNSLSYKKTEELRLKAIREYQCVGRIELPDTLVIDAASDGKIWSWEDEEPKPDISLSKGTVTTAKMRNENEVNSMEAIPQRPSIYRLFDRVRKRIKRTVRLGIPTEETFNNAIANVPQNAHHKYVILGGSAILECGIDKSNSGDIVRYSWTHNNDDPITAPMSKVNQNTGTLEIPVVQFTDVGLYKCTAFRKDDRTSQTTQTKTKHQISVISEPIFFITNDRFYSTKTCNPHELELIRDKIPEWIQYYVWKYCEVHSIKVKCSTAKDSKKLIQVTMTISAIGAQFTSFQTSNLKKCEITCLELLHSKILSIIQETVTKLLNRPIEVKGGSEKQRKIHEPELSLTKSELFEECLPGFAIHHKLCFPCNPGHFSQPKMKKCANCHIGTYQNNPASSECIPCPTGTTTLKEGSSEESDCSSKILTNPVNLLYNLLPEKLTGETRHDKSDVDNTDRQEKVRESKAEKLASETRHVKYDDADRTEKVRDSKDEKLTSETRHDKYDDDDTDSSEKVRESKSEKLAGPGRVAQDYNDEVRGSDIVDLVEEPIFEKLTGRAGQDYSDYYDDYSYDQDVGGDHSVDQVKESISEKQGQIKVAIKWIIIASSILIIILIILILIRCFCPYSGLGKVVSMLCCFCCPPAPVKLSKKKDTKQNRAKPRKSK